jgi:competence ComEA-like helix-hairpin-helix protein
MMWRARLRDPAWRDPLVVAASASVALLAIAFDVNATVRVPLTMWFLLTGPGLALVPLLGLDGFKWVGVIAGSLVANVLVTEFMLYTGIWSAGIGMGLILIICTIGVGLQVHRLLATELVPAHSNEVDRVLVSATNQPPVYSRAVVGFDLNRASVAELQELNGIGPVLAARIVAFREVRDPLADAEDLLGVSGIGMANLDDMRHAISNP